MVSQLEQIDSIQAPEVSSTDGNAAEGARIAATKIKLKIIGH